MLTLRPQFTLAAPLPLARLPTLSSPHHDQLQSEQAKESGEKSLQTNRLKTNKQTKPQLESSFFSSASCGSMWCAVLWPRVSNGSPCSTSPSLGCCQHSSRVKLLRELQFSIHPLPQAKERSPCRASLWSLFDSLHLPQLDILELFTNRSHPPPDSWQSSAHTTDVLWSSAALLCKEGNDFCRFTSPEWAILHKSSYVYVHTYMCVNLLRWFVSTYFIHWRWYLWIYTLDFTECSVKVHELLGLCRFTKLNPWSMFSLQLFKQRTLGLLKSLTLSSNYYLSTWLSFSGCRNSVHTLGDLNDRHLFSFSSGKVRSKKKGLVSRCFLLRKEQAPKRQQPDSTKQDRIKQGKSLYIKAGHGNPLREKESQGQAKESETHPLPLFSIPQNYQAISHNRHAEDLVQTHVGPVLAASVCVSPCEPCLGDSVSCVLLNTCVLHPLQLNLSTPSFVGFPSLPMGGTQWRPPV